MKKFIVIAALLMVAFAINAQTNSTTVEAREYAPDKWDWNLTVRADKINLTAENGKDIVTSLGQVKTQVVAVLAVLYDLDNSIVIDSINVTITPLKTTEPLE